MPFGGKYKNEEYKNLPVEGSAKPAKPEYKSSTPIKKLAPLKDTYTLENGTTIVAPTGTFSSLIEYSYKNNYGKLGSVGFKDMKNGYVYHLTIEFDYKIGSGGGFGPRPNLTSED